MTTLTVNNDEKHCYMDLKRFPITLECLRGPIYQIWSPWVGNQKSSLKTVMTVKLLSIWQIWIRHWFYWPIFTIYTNFQLSNYKIAKIQNGDFDR